jgi:DNA repair protein RadA
MVGTKKNEPNKMQTPLEMLKKEKGTDEKTPSEMEKDVSNLSVSGETKESKAVKEDAKKGKGEWGIPGIGQVTEGKLRALGYTNVLAIATARPDEISAELGIGYPTAKTWVQYAQDRVLAKMKPVNAVDYDKEMKAKTIFIKTGSSNVNNLLGGGIATMATTGLSGRFATGKTQIVNDAVTDCIGRLKEEAAIIETEPGTVHLDRLKQIATLKKLDCDWSKLWIFPADQIPTVKAQFLQYRLIQKLLEEGHKIRLVAVDSFTAKFRPGYSRREMLPVRTREFTEHFLLIDFLAAKYNIAWLLTCQVIGAPDPGQQHGSQMKTGDVFYPVGGEYLLHSVNTWVGLSQIKTELWQAVLFDSSYLPRGSREFMLSPSGIQDPPK